MNFVNVLEVVLKIQTFGSTIHFIETYGFFVFEKLIKFIIEAEKTKLAGKEKLVYVLDELKITLEEAEKIEEGEQIPVWIPDMINMIIRIINNVVKEGKK